MEPVTIDMTLKAEPIVEKEEVSTPIVEQEEKGRPLNPSTVEKKEDPAQEVATDSMIAAAANVVEEPS